MEIPDKSVTAPDFAEPPVFAEPWHAELFAMTVHLHKQGLFSWLDWTAQLSEALAAAGKHHTLDGGDDYYAVWLDTLLQIMIAQGVTDDSSVQAMQEQWRNAYVRTPHGKPVRLEDDGSG